MSFSTRPSFSSLFAVFEKRINPYPEQEPATPPDGLAAFIWHYTKPVAPWIVAMALVAALFAIAEVSLFGFMGSIVDWLASAEREGFFAREGWKLFWMGALVLVGMPVLVLAHNLIIHQTLLGNYPMIGRWQMHRYLLKQSMGFFANEFAGRVATKVMQTSLAIRETVIKIMDVFVYVSVYFVSMIVMVIGADFRLALPLLVWLAIYVFLVAKIIPRLKRVSALQADARSTMTGRIVDSYTNISTVKLFSHAGREADYAREGMDRFLLTVHAQMRLVSLLNLFVQINNFVATFVVSALAIYLWYHSAVSVGAIAIIIALTLRLHGTSQWIMWETSSLFENIGVVHDGMQMLKQKQQIVDRPGAADLVVSKGEISFDHIRFHYGKEGGVIEDLSLLVKPGEKIGLVGRSGAGKSTLTSLLLRFYDLEGGKITIDGVDVSTVKQDSLRSQIGVVTQDTSLLHRSIRDNIAYGRQGVSDKEIERAIARANASEFVADLEDLSGRKGLDAHVGERGVKLSGGQRQRIAIARVFLKDAPILVLDEATSALDSEVEEAIQENLFKLMEGKTVIAIAHRLSTISQMDRLVVLDKGQIVETGSHDELVARGGLYAQLWSRQSGGLLATEEELTEA